MWSCILRTRAVGEVMKAGRQDRVNCQALGANILVGVAETELVVGGVGGVAGLACSDEGSEEGVGDPAASGRVHGEDGGDVDEEYEEDEEDEPQGGAEDEEDED